MIIPLKVSKIYGNFLQKIAAFTFFPYKIRLFGQKIRIVKEIKVIYRTQNLNLNSLTTKPPAIKYKSS